MECQIAKSTCFLPNYYCALYIIQHGAIFTGTCRDNGIMYDGMIKAFNKAISSLVEE
ncbi:hypothetical protein B0O99DRAFT_152354 [Bisporella sp. PMI_857]|nr:hypothetical protein B0O99DRAFT_152354 [Bisporella sp. PMI_857]